MTTPSRSVIQHSLGNSRWVYGWILPLLAAGLPIWVDLWQFARQAPNLPRWDMAKYGAAASRMQQAMESLQPWSLLQEIHQLSSWPFVLPLFEGIVFLFWDNSFQSARALMVALLVVTCLLVIYLGHRLSEDPLEGTVLAWWTLPILLTSPMLQLYGVLNMLEIPGSLLTLLCLALYDQAVRQPQRGAPWWALGVASCLLFFCKYNYGLMWFVALGLAELRRHCGSWRAAWTLAWNLAIHRRFGPWQIFVMAVLAILAWIRLRGGLELQVGSVEIRATSIGNPIYGLLILSVGRLVFLAGVRRRALHTWRRWTLPSRIFGWTLGLPILVWMLLPPHCKDFFGFVENRSSGLSRWSLESTWFYGQSLSDDFLAWPWLTWPLLGLALWGAVISLRRSLPTHRVLALYVAIHAVALWAHPYKLPRFAVTLFVPLVLLAAWGASDLLRCGVVPALRRFGGSEHRPRRMVMGIALATMLLIATLQGRESSGTSWRLGLIPRENPSWLQRFEEQTVSPVAGEVLDRILHWTQDQEAAFIGTWNLFSPSLVEWRRSQLGQSANTLWVGRSLERRQRKRMPWPPRVVILELDPDAWRDDLAGAFLAETERQRQWGVSLLHSGEYLVLAEESHEDAGYRWMVLDRVP